MEADLIMRDAKVKADQYLSDIKAQTEKEKLNLDNLKREAALFKSKMVSFYKSHIDALNGLDDLKSVNLRLSSNVYKTAGAFMKESAETPPAIKDSPLDPGKEENLFSGKTDVPVFETPGKSPEPEKAPEKDFSDTRPIPGVFERDRESDKEKLKSLFFGFDSRSEDDE